MIFYVVIINLIGNINRQKPETYINNKLCTPLIVDVLLITELPLKSRFWFLKFDIDKTKGSYCLM